MESQKILQSPSYQLEEIVDTFHQLLEKSGRNLDRLAGNNAFLIPEDGSEELSDDLKKFLILIKEAYKENKDILAVFDNLDKGEHSDKFVMLLGRYLEFSGRPVKETAFLRELTVEEFSRLASYCYSNYIISSSDTVQKTESWNNEQVHIMRKVILTISELVVLLNYSKQQFLERIEMMFGLTEGYGEVLWNMAKQNENQLWKYLMVMRSERIEEKLDLLLELIQNTR